MLQIDAESQVAMLWVILMVVLPILPAFLLFKFLPSAGDVEGPLHGVKVKFGGAFAGYLCVFLALWYARPETGSHFHNWTVTGVVSVETAPGESEPNLNDVFVRFVPPRLGIMNQGAFAWDIPVSEDATGQRQFPDLQIDLRGYRGMTIPLNQTRAYGAVAVKVKYDDARRVISIEDPIVLKSAQGGRGYQITATPLAPMRGATSGVQP